MESLIPSETASAASRLRRRSSANVSCPLRTLLSLAVEPHALGGERAQVDVVAAVASGDVVVGAEPHGVRVGELVDSPGVVAHFVEPGHDVPATVAPGDARRGPDGEVHPASGQVQVFGDLAAGLPGADDQDVAVGQLVRVAVLGRVQLDDVLRQPLGQPRLQRHLVRAGGQHDVVGGQLAGRRRQPEPAAGQRLQPLRFDALAQRDVEGLHVRLEVGDDLVPDHETVRIITRVGKPGSRHCQFGVTRQKLSQRRVRHSCPARSRSSTRCPTPAEVRQWDIESPAWPPPTTITGRCRPSSSKFMPISATANHFRTVSSGTSARYQNAVE